MSNYTNSINNTSLQLTTYSAALSWLAKGIAVVPAQPRSKVVLYRWRQLETELPSPEQVKRWFANGIMNLALLCGTGGLQVLDFDSMTGFELWSRKAGNIATTYTELTGRGVHLFYQVDQPKTFRFLEGEALGPGHLCLAAPSVHPNGKYYKSLGLSYPVRKIQSELLFSLLSEIAPADPVEPKGETLSNKKAGGDLVARIKAAFPVVELAKQYTSLKASGGAGRYLVGRCPFHEDKFPSFWIDQQKNLWGCYSPSCAGSRGGDVINLYALLKGISTGEAIKALAREVLS